VNSLLDLINNARAEYSARMDQPDPEPVYSLEDEFDEHAWMVGFIFKGELESGAEVHGMYWWSDDCRCWLAKDEVTEDAAI